MAADLKGLLSRLNPYCTRALEAASGLCVNRSHYEVSIEHMLLQLMEDPQADIHLVLRHFEIEPSSWIKQLQQQIEEFKDGNPGKPVFSASLLSLFKDAWMMSSVQLGQVQIRSAALLAVIVENPLRYGTGFLDDIDNISIDEVIKQFPSIAEVSTEETKVAATAATANSAAAGGSALEKYTTNFTEKARNGEIDPVFGRDREIRQMVDILGRRRKNNPIAVGEAGVGKTAVIEGLAVKIAEGDVPDIIKNVELVSLDLGLLQAGASVKGEFENRLSGVINEIKSSETPIILFIDEAHTLIGAGGAAGTGDAANLLKPALARGELRTVAATTWSEYKKYFEKDPALARRFQLVKLDEPTVENAMVILRGLREVYEKAHGVYVRDEAIVTAAAMSARYITGRQLPDKAVDVLDTACARVNISLSTKPGAVEDLEQRTRVLEREKNALERDINTGRSKAKDRLAELIEEINNNKVTLEQELVDWKIQKELVDKVIALRIESDNASTGDSESNDSQEDEPDTTEAKAEAGADSGKMAMTEEDVAGAVTGSADKTATESATESVSKRNADEVRKDLVKAIEELEEFQTDKPKISYEVTADVVAQIVSDWTGVPLGSIVKDEAASLLSFNNSMKSWVKGQDHAIDVIDSGIRTAKAGLQNPDQPHGIFLFVGPSGVGKTETALGVANLMFGGEQFMTTINMSEYQEKHTISRLVGSPAGYVGYGEGGVLSEAVRQRPYSVVLLDEVEKADLEVMNLFYQVFDKGTLSDGEGRSIDFRNTIIFLTSNLASATIMEMCADGKTPTMDELTEAIRPELQAHFKPALLARMTVVPFFPIQGDVLNAIVKIKLDKVGKRLKLNQSLNLLYGDDVIDQIADRCTDIESGARNIDHIVNKTLLPLISTEILTNIGEETEYTNLQLGIGPKGEFVTEFH